MTDEKRKFVHGLWAAVADAWIERADYLDERGAPVTQAILEGANLTRSDDVLALADGPGGLALAAATKSNRVVSSDVVPELVAAARRRAEAEGLDNVSVRIVDIEAMDARDQEFDAVISREGLMFVIDPTQAFAEIARVLVAGGRLAAAVWAAPEANPWLSILMDAVSEVVGHPVPPQGMPGPFALSSEAMLRELAAGAGFDQVRVDRVDVPFHAASFEAWWAQTSALAGPLAKIVAGLDAAQAQRLESLLRTRTEAYASASGLDFPGESLVLLAQKP